MTNTDVVVVDYEAGNLKSVETALRELGVSYIISSEPETVLSAPRVIFPGVGEAGAAMNVLNKTGLDEALKSFFSSGKPFLGICIGCQLVLEHSEESDTDTLGIVPGRVVAFDSKMGLKVPHMGWNTVSRIAEHKIWDGIPSGSSFYFVHSFYPVPDVSVDALGKTDYGVSFTSAFCKDNLIAVQFHPEKSGPYGLKLLSNFFSL
ncbi:imidazole glycerol phosphate synthase subunit HisH [Spirochaetia bacterium 38H-sp]|uniref:Imidazole glycerol phosphate synthase subunit HisH n=1 Tax=Rarispira pelagica TaxID=3141764 RepID=A0ABU9UCG0_9SPIR